MGGALLVLHFSDALRGGIFVIERCPQRTRLITEPLHECADTLSLSLRVRPFLTYDELVKLRELVGTPNPKVATTEQAHADWVERGKPVNVREPAWG